jgi:phosphonate transport system substrate-binding protein
MAYQFTISPDIAPDRIASWFVLNTWLQRQIDQSVHLRLFDSFAEQRRAIAAKEIDLIFANPYDAAMLVREHGFQALARPTDGSDEAVLVVAADSPIRSVEDVRADMTIATTDEPSVDLMGMIMLEPSGVPANALRIQACSSFVLVAKALLRGQAQIGILLARAYDELSATTRAGLRMLVRSQIDVVQHQWLVGPRMAALREPVCRALVVMHDDAKGQALLKPLGVSGWAALEDEDVEFMIDLMDTLRA